MENNIGTLSALVKVFSQAISFLYEKIQDEGVVQVFSELGLTFSEEIENDSDISTSIDNVLVETNGISAELANLNAHIQNGDYIEIANSTFILISKIEILKESFDTLSERLNEVTTNNISNTDLIDFSAKLPENLFSYLIIKHLEGYYPIQLKIIEFFGIIERNIVETDFTDSAKPQYIERKLKFEKIKDLFGDTTNYLKNLYGWGTSSLNSNLLLERIHDLLFYFHIPFSLDFDQNANNNVLFFYFGDLKPLGSPPTALELVLSRTFNSGIAIDMPFVYDNWKLNLELEGNIEPTARIIFEPNKVSFTHPSAQFNGKLLLNLQMKKDDSSPYYLFGMIGGSSLTIGDAIFGIGSSLKWNTTNLTSEGKLLIQLALNDGKLKINSKEGDGFLSNILPIEIESDFNLLVKYSLNEGFFIDGGVGLNIVIPLHKSFLGINFERANLSLNLSTGDILIFLSADLDFKIGPISGLISQMGVKGKIKPEEGNLGPMDASIGFKPPSGIGINIDTEAVKGGGYLYINTEDGRYAGVAGINIKDKIKLSAFGLINTKFPDGRKGYSFLIFVSAEFSPVQLGFGFTLSGVGGLVGIHRSINIDRLREGVKTKAYDRLLFPENPVENALEIIADLEAIFPVSEGRYVFGIMGKIGWGSPTLITIDLGLIIEVPNPVKLAILGVVKAILPDEQKAVLKLQVNFLGVIDFGKKQLSFDATIYDSKLLTFSLAGDMAMRLSWGSNSNFLMSVGGFHPSYQPPPQLISMKRLTLNLLGGDNPRLTLTTYFAVTSNTVQFGAKVELYVKVASKLTAEGAFGFDALFQFNPFYMKILAAAYVAIKWNNKEKFSISLSAALEGPKPWNVDGVAEIKVFFIKYKVQVQKTWGQPQDASLPSVSVTPMLAEAMKKVENWSSTLTSGKQQLVTLRKIVTDESIMLPEGVLVISQKVLPMNINIQLFGTQEVNDGGLFSIGDVTLNNNVSATSKTYVKEDFVPAHFRKMSETEKLSGPSFQKYDGGIRLDGMNKLQGSEIKPKEIKYETIVYDPVEDSTLPGGSIYENDKIHAAMLRGSKAGQSGLSASKNIAPLAPKPIVVKEEEYGVVKISDLTLVESSALCASFTEAQDYYLTKVVEDIAWKNKLKIIPKFEIQTA